MAISILTSLDLGGINQLLNIKLQNLASDPAANESGLYYNTTTKEVRYHNGTNWIALGPAGAGGPPTGGAGGDLAGTYPTPTIGLGKVVLNYMAPNTFASGETINSVSGTATAAIPALRALGTTADRACAGNDARLSDARTPLSSASATGDLAGSTFANLQIAAGAITDVDVAAANKDGLAGTASMRTLGTGSLQACAGNDSRLSDARTPLGSATASGDLSGSTWSNLQIAAGAIVDADVASANKDGAVGTYSLRTLGSGAQQAMPGNRTLDAITAPAASLSMNSKNITNLLDPVSAQDAATKNYVDNTAAGLSWKDSARAATTVASGNIATLAGGAPNSLDGVTLAANDRVLVKNQTTASQNGLYYVATLGTGSNGTWTRATDADSAAELDSMVVFVSEGTTNADTSWVLTTNMPITVGSTNLAYSQFGGGATYVGGAGITQNGNTFDIVSTSGDLTVQADNITVVSAPKWTTTRTITLTGDVTSSAVNIDGTGNVSIATSVGSTGTAPPKFFAVSVGDGANGGTGAVVAPVITHGLNSRDVTVEVYRSTTPYDTVMCDCERTSVNTVTLRFASAPPANTYRVVITGR